MDLALHQLAVTRLLERHLHKWRAAHDGLSGAGSTYLRALAIHGIYDAAAPLPDAAMTQDSAKFLKKIRDIVTAAIEENGGRVELSGPSK